LAICHHPKESNPKHRPKTPVQEKPGESKVDQPKDNTPVEVAKVLPNGSVLITGPVKKAPTLVLTLPAGWLSAIKIELLPHQEHKNSILRNRQ